MGHYRHVPRSFAGAQDDGGSGKGQRPLAADSSKRTADSCLGFRLSAPGFWLPAVPLSRCPTFTLAAPSRRPVFTDRWVIIGMYQDPSLALRMTVGAGRDSARWQRIAVSGRLSSCPAGDPVTLSLYSWPKAIPPPSARRAAAPFYTTRRRQAATTLGAKGPVHLLL